MATFRKRNGKWQVQVRRQGSPIQSRSFLSKADADEWAREMERRHDRQELGPDRKVLKSITLAELVERYRDEVLPNKPKSKEVETIILNRFLRHPICRKPLSDLTTADFASYRDERLKENKQRSDSPITPKSLKRQLSPIQNMFHVGIEEWEIPLRCNPLAGLKLQVTDKKRERRLLAGELERLLEAGKKTRNKLIISIVRFALETAMRRGEILSLRWRDIDEQRATATLLETKNGHSRVIPLTDMALEILRSVSPEKRQENGRVFPVAANALRLSWGRLIKRAKIDDLHFHDLRHEAISRLFELGLTVPEVASISGHRDMRMLFRYAHASHASIRVKFRSIAQDQGISAR